MKRNIFILLLLVGCIAGRAQEPETKTLAQWAEAEEGKGNVTGARSLFVRAYEDCARKGQTEKGVECGVKATALYYKENLYNEAFDLLRRIDQNIEAASQKSPAAKAAMHYQTSRERFQMYMKMRRSASAMDQLNAMERHAGLAGDEGVRNDLLYNKTVYYYAFGENQKGNAAFKEMADKLTAQKEYDKVDEVYQTLIANGRRSNSASLVAQSYSSYIVWKDSVAALKVADEIGALKQQIAENEETIAGRDASLASRRAVIVGLCIVLAVMAALLVLGALVLIRFIVLTRKQQKDIKRLKEDNALKAKFIGNISAQLTPTLQRLDGRAPEVKALLDFSDHVQTLSALENAPGGDVELEETQVAQFCETLMEEIRSKVRDGVSLTVNAPKMSVRINKDHVSHILLHLLRNAAAYTPENGHITLEFKKRGAHTHQFLVADTGQGITGERREDIFKPFLEVRDLTTGDGLGLPICKQMALKMGGDLSVDPAFTKGTRFVLELHA